MQKTIEIGSFQNIKYIQEGIVLTFIFWFILASVGALEDNDLLFFLSFVFAAFWRFRDDL